MHFVHPVYCVLWELSQYSNYVIGWMTGVSSQQGLEFFLLAIMSRSAVRPTKPLIQWVLGVLSPVVKWPGHEADHSPPSSVKVKNA